MLLELLALAGQNAQRLFSSAPYTGTGSAQSVATGIDATGTRIAVFLKGLAPEDLDPPVFDTVRGLTKRVRTSTVNEDTFSAVTVSGKNRVLTGANYNMPGTEYTAWNFLCAPKFLDIVTFSGGAGATAHVLGETPVAALVFQRTGSGALYPILWLAGESTYLANSVMLSGVPFIMDAATFTPNGTIFAAGHTFVVYLFGSGSSNLATGSYVGTVPGNTDDTQDVTLPFAPSFMVLWGPSFYLDPTGVGARALDVRIASSLEDFNGLAFIVSGGGLSGTLAGSTFTARSTSQPLNPNATTTACLDGETYRYLVIR